MEGRYQTFLKENRRLEEAHRILILGGGAVGVELASEIVDHFPNKFVTIIDSQSMLVPTFHNLHVSRYAQQWLRCRGVTLRLGTKLASWNDTSCTLQDGTVLQADIVYVCFGLSPNSNPVVPLLSSSTSRDNCRSNKNNSDKSSSPTLFALTRRRNVVVKDTLQVVVTSSLLSSSLPKEFRDNSTIPIFACGDVACPPTNNEKQAFQAEMQGQVAARNVLLLLQNSVKQSPSSLSSISIHNRQERSLYRYPKDIIGTTNGLPLVYVLSLGRYDGVVGFNSFCIPGPLAAVVKWLVEYTKVLQMKGEPLGSIIWKIGDAVTLFLSRTIASSPRTSAASKSQKSSLLRIAWKTAPSSKGS
jgi:NADH dehydrogenase FAD-containing subunit